MALYRFSDIVSIRIAGYDNEIYLNRHEQVAKRNANEFCRRMANGCMRRHKESAAESLLTGTSHIFLFWCKIQRHTAVKLQLKKLLCWKSAEQLSIFY